MTNAKKLFSIFIFCLCALNLKLSANEPSYQFTTDGPVYVFADVHGAFNELQTALRTSALIDEQDKWIGANAHLVSLGDLIDRGPQSRKVLDLLKRLQVEAEEAGGKVHVVKGNHEVMNLVGDLRYVAPEEYAEFASDETEELRETFYARYLKNSNQADDQNARQSFDEKFPAGFFAHRAAYKIDGEYGSWLMTLPFVIQINDQVFAHAGLSKSVYNKSLAELNNELQQTLKNYLVSWNQLIDDGKLKFDDSYHKSLDLMNAMTEDKAAQEFVAIREQLLFSSQSPTWYRGNSICHPIFEQDILSTKLAEWQATRLWVGHTVTINNRVNQRLDGQLIMLDAGMLKSYYDGEPFVAKIANDQVEFIHGVNGEILSASFAPNREQGNPHGLSDAELEDFLTNAPIIEKKVAKEGRTKPIRITLERDGKTIKAIFKYRAAANSRGQGRLKRKIASPDRYQNEVAAYKLDRMMDINLVPVSVERVIDGKRGSLQLWLDDLTNVLTMKKNNIEYNGYCDYEAQINMMDSYDYLIANSDRNQSNIMYSSSDFQLWLIDHSMAFGTSTRRPAMIKRATIEVTDSFKAALEKLTEEKLQTLSPWLSSSQIKALWKRRNKMLAGDF